MAKIVGLVFDEPVLEPEIVPDITPEIAPQALEKDNAEPKKGRKKKEA